MAKHCIYNVSVAKRPNYNVQSSSKCYVNIHFIT